MTDTVNTSELLPITTSSDNTLPDYYVGVKRDFLIGRNHIKDLIVGDSRDKR